MKLLLSLKRQLSLGLILLVLAYSCSPTATEQDIKTEIEKINESMMAAINSQDVEALMVHYSNDVVLFPSNNEATEGYDAVKQMWINGFEHGMGSLEFISSDATAIGNMAQEHGVYKYYTPDNQMVDHGKYIVVWKKEGDQWKIAKDIWNSSMPLPPRATMKDTIAIAVTKVKPEHMETFSKLATDVFLPAFNTHYPKVKATTRLFKVLKTDQGEAKLIYLIDPLTKGHEHDVKKILSAHYTEDEVEQYMKTFNSSVIKQDIVYAVPLW